MKKLDKTFKINPLYEADGYKVSHKRMLALGTTKLYGTWIPRSLKYMHPSIEKPLSIGQQFVVRHLHSTFQEYFFDVPKEEAMQFVRDLTPYLGIHFDGKHFEALYDLRFLPIQIQSLPEGIFTPINIPHMTFINTFEDYAWLTLFLETYISKLSWQISTVATIGAKFKENAKKALLETDSASLGFEEFMCHDFHSRGGNPFTSIVAGLGHAFSNFGSDTLNVIPAARYYYDAGDDEVVVNSVTASEHSVSCVKIFTVGERQMIIDWLKEFPTGILSIVADTFDLWKLLVEYMGDPVIVELVNARDGKVVIRPDSGDPVDIICGTDTKIYHVSLEGDNTPDSGTLNDFILDLEDGDLFCLEGKYYKAINVDEFNKKYGINAHYEIWDGTTNMGSLISQGIILEISKTYHPSDKGVVEILADIYGFTLSNEGYKVLNPKVGVIYGDAINLDRQVEIYSRLKAKGFAATNVVVGVGSFSYVGSMTRDSMGFAAKGAWFICNGNKIDIYKDPITDDGTKKSLKGLQYVYYEEDGSIGIKSEVGESIAYHESNLLKTIYKNGLFYNKVTFNEIRKTLKESS